MLTRKVSPNSAPWCFVILFLILFPAGISAQNPKSLKPQGYVNDFANVLSSGARQKLTALCTEVNSKADAQIAVVTVSSLNGEDVEQYSLDLAMQWGVGPKDKSRGVMILFAPHEHKYRFEVGYGLEGILPDGKVGGFGREAVPLLRQNDYDGAIVLVTQRVAAVIAADKGVTLDSLSSVPPPHASTALNSSSDWLNPRTMFIVAVLIVFLSRMILPMIFGGGSNYRRRGGSGWWIGPMMGGGGGGGFGGFGGGSFGGGGASGSW